MIRDKYLIPDSKGRSDDTTRVRMPGLVRTLPSNSLNNSLREQLPRLANHPIIQRPNIQHMSFSERGQFWARFIDIQGANNAVFLTGYVLKDVLDIMNATETNGGFSARGTKGTSKITLDIFDDLEGIIFNYVSIRFFEEFKLSPYWTRHFQYLYQTERKVSEDEFALFRVLGRGGFGLVNACKRCTTGKLYAMKTLNKRRIKMKKADALCLNERNILALVQTPFVVCLKYAFTTTTDVSLVLDLMTGGDLGFHLSRKGRFSEKEAKYFAARTLLGIAALHEIGIAYRDLKPENILMDELGCTRLSDLGLACKVGRSGITGTCGTRGYWAPEMLKRDAAGKRERYTVCVDWFSFGCVVYEFLCGVSPFRTDRARKWGDFPKVEKADRDKAIDLAIQQMEPEFDDTLFSATSKDVINQLLKKDPRQRLGVNGYTAITSHPWFRGTVTSEII